MTNSEKQETQYKLSSAAYTLLICASLLTLSLIFGFTLPKPSEEPEGLLVDFGYDETGLGTVEPQTAPEPTSASAPEASAQKDILTQDVDESVTIHEVKKPEVKVIPTTSTNTKSNSTNVTPQETIDKTQLFSKDKMSQMSNSKSEGTNPGAGNEGSPTGDPNGYQGTGAGIGDNGSVGWNLHGRNMKSFPTMRADQNESGDVRIAITVDKNGNVVKADYERTGSTIVDASLINKARTAALLAKFNTDSNAEEIEHGYITFHIKLQ